MKRHSGAAPFLSTKLTSGSSLTPEARSRLRNGSEHGFSSYSVVREDLDRLHSAKPEADLLERMIYQELKLRLPELLLMRVDKMTMATSVEARVPFLDHKLVEFAMTIPQGMKYRERRDKAHSQTRAQGRGSGPRASNRKKKGFGAPIKEWMLDRLGGFVEDAL